MQCFCNIIDVFATFLIDNLLRKYFKIQGETMKAITILLV